MSPSIFSTYSKGENRVTSSILAVMQSLSLQRTERILGALVEQPEFQLVRFQNQPSKGQKGVPDAEISSHVRILIEAKIDRDSVSRDQLQRYVTQLGGEEPTQMLLVLTPDEIRPNPIEQLNDERVVWNSFASLDQAVEELLTDDTEVVSEREAFLLRQLQAMLLEEGLLSSANDVVAVAARNAWPEYQQTHAYVCQAGRVFQPVKFMAFYSSGQIQPIIPRILDFRDSVVFDPGANKGRYAEVVAATVGTYGREAGQSFKVILLSGPDDPQTERLAGPIPNDLMSGTGRATAFTQGQRYISLSDLKLARTTSDLVIATKHHAK